ncbi:MAG: hypothetical protein WCP55_04685, partial [Lentisphaerota bacterium]
VKWHKKKINQAECEIWFDLEFRNNIPFEINPLCSYTISLKRNELCQSGCMPAFILYGCF